MAKALRIFLCHLGRQNIIEFHPSLSVARFIPGDKFLGFNSAIKPKSSEPQTGSLVMEGKIFILQVPNIMAG